MAGMRTSIRHVAATAAFVCVYGLGGAGAVHAAGGQLTPLKGYEAASVYNDGHPSEMAAISLFWGLTPAQVGQRSMNNSGLLSFLGTAIETHNALTVLPDHGLPRAWTIPGMVEDVWPVSGDEYAILVRTWWHAPPEGLPFVEELLGLDVHGASLTTLWRYRGKLGTNPDVARGDGTACGVVLTWHGRHISLRRLPNPYPGSFGYVPLALFLGTNTCK